MGIERLKSAAVGSPRARGYYFRLPSLHNTLRYVSQSDGALALLVDRYNGDVRALHR